MRRGSRRAKESAPNGSLPQCAVPIRNGEENPWHEASTPYDSAKRHGLSKVSALECGDSSPLSDAVTGRGVTPAADESAVRKSGSELPHSKVSPARPSPELRGSLHAGQSAGRVAQTPVLGGLRQPRRLWKAVAQHHAAEPQPKPCHGRPGHARARAGRPRHNVGPSALRQPSMRPMKTSESQGAG